MISRIISKAPQKKGREEARKVLDSVEVIVTPHDGQTFIRDS
jgi:hypothetical protein